MFETTEEKKTIAHFNSAFGIPVFNLGINFENNYGVGILLLEEPQPDPVAAPIRGMNWNTTAVHVYCDPNSRATSDNKKTLEIMQKMGYTPTEEEAEGEQPIFINVTPDFLVEILAFVKSLDKC